MLKDKLKELREKKGLSQQELADKLFVSRSAVAKWENGNGIPSEVNLDAICKFFNIDEESLVDKSTLREVIKNVEISKRSILILSFLLIICITVFCFLIGGTYNLHRIGIAFTFFYFLFSFLIPKRKITTISSIIFLIAGILISLLNWLITGIPEPSNLFRILTGDTGDISLSQFSSILNIVMIVSYNVISIAINKTKK